MQRLLRATVLIAAASLGGLAVYSEFPLCPLGSGLGIPCPGCGLTRATLALLRGDVRGALHFHPLVWLLAPLFAGLVLAAAIELLRDPARPRPKPLVKWNGRAVTTAASIVLALTLGVWIARFAGYLGGPVPVTSLRAWLAR